MLHYLHDTDKTTLTTKVSGVGEDPKGRYLLLDETVFYPQGGGQPADQGTIKIGAEIIPIHFVGFVEGSVRHYTTASVSENLIGQAVLCEIDYDRRILNARYHTVGHILADVVSNIYKSARAVKGHQFPGEAYVEFIDTPAESMDISAIQAALETCINKAMPIQVYEMAKKEYEGKYGVLPYPTPDDKPFRLIGIESFPPVPCGGTHLRNTKELGAMKVRNTTEKQGRIKVSYEL